MLAQVPFPGAGDPAIGLIETFRWSSKTGFDLLAEHMARLGHSAAICGFPFQELEIRHALDAFADGLVYPCCRVRLVLLCTGRCEIVASPLPAALPTPYRVALAKPRHRAGDPWLAHKTTMRDRYEGPLAHATAAGTADEVLFLNEREELCEGARSNLFVDADGTLLTPPLASGLLPGTLRAHLLHAGRAREAVLHISDIGPGAEWFLGNSVRGLVRAYLVGK